MHLKGKVLKLFNNCKYLVNHLIMLVSASKVSIENGVKFTAIEL